MAWNSILVSGLIASVVVSVAGCTASVTAGNPTADAGTGGVTSSAGGASAGGSSAGGASAGGSSAGGASAGGSSAGGASAGGTASTDAGPDGPCTVCLKAKCGAEYIACGNDPDQACGAVGTDPGEFVKIQECMFAVTGDSSTPVFTAADLQTCAGNNAKSGPTPSDATQALLTCINGAADASTQPCTTECYGAPVPFN